MSPRPKNSRYIRGNKLIAARNYDDPKWFKTCDEYAQEALKKEGRNYPDVQIKPSETLPKRTPYFLR